MNYNKYRLVKENNDDNIMNDGTFVQDNRQIHLHNHYHNTSQDKENIKPRLYIKDTRVPRKCLMCNVRKRMFEGEYFCSPRCRTKYDEYRRAKVRLQMKEFYESQKPKRRWWQW